MDTDNDDPLEHRRDELRRIVYGIPGEPAPEVAAELAAVEAELVSRDRGDESDASAPRDHADPDRRAPTERAGDRAETVEPLQPAVPAAAVAESEPPEPPVPNGPPEPPGPDSGGRRRPTRTRLLAAAVAVVVLVGGGIALLGPVRDALSPPHGLGVFEREQTPEELDRSDEVATGAGLQTSAIASLRSLGRAFGHDFWVFRDDRRVCLLSRREFFFGWVETCASIEVFAAHGLTRRIPADDIRDGARPRRIGPGDVVVVTWGPESTEVEWTVEP
jgi:hypothetical protein